MRVLIYDIETTPLLSWNWGTYQQNAIRVEQDWYMLCFAYKWHGEKTNFVGLPDFKRFKRNKTDDLEVCKALHELLNEADVVVAHNGDKFDMKKAQARFLYHGLPPVRMPIQVDTLKEVRKIAQLTSNRLDALGEFFDLGRKTPHTGIDLWFDCMKGDPKAWKLMKKYNLQDVDLLEAVYDKLRPYMKNHPNMALINEQPNSCTRCNGRLIRDGYRYTSTNKYQQWECVDCGAKPSSRVPEKIDKPEVK